MAEANFKYIKKVLITSRNNVKYNRYFYDNKTLKTAMSNVKGGAVAAKKAQKIQALKDSHKAAKKAVDKMKRSDPKKLDTPFGRKMEKQRKAVAKKLKGFGTLKSSKQKAISKALSTRK